MIEFEPFVAGLTKIGLALKQPYGAASLTVYHDILGTQTDAEEWPRFVHWALKTSRWTPHTPDVPQIQAALREYRGARPLMAEATEAYEQVLASGIYTPEGGTTWNYRTVKERCGQAAAEAFLAAGAHSAFATTWNEDKRRERFVAVYSEAVRENPANALPSGGTKALPAARLELTKDEAKETLRRLEEALQDR